MANPLTTYPPEFRQAVILKFKQSHMRLNGKMSVMDFLDSLGLLSDDERGEFHRHTVRFDDWDNDWQQDILVKTLLDADDATFEKMITYALSVECESSPVFLESREREMRPVFARLGVEFRKNDLYGVFTGYHLALAKSPVNNQGRAHSKNVAPLQHMGLLFRSQAEIELCRELLRAGYLIAPLAVFVQVSDGKLRRCEPDFMVVKYGMWAVVEVDGEAWHHETPAQAAARLLGFTDQDVKVIRVPATIASGPDWAKRSLEFVNERFEEWRKARR